MLQGLGSPASTSKLKAVACLVISRDVASRTLNMSKARQVVEVKRNQLAPQLLVLSVSASPRLHSCQMLSLRQRRQRRRQTARLCQRLQPRQPRSCYFRGTAPPHRIRSSSPVQAETITDLRKLDEHLSTRSYFDGGHKPSQADVAQLAATPDNVSPEQFPHVARWYRRFVCTAQASTEHAGLTLGPQHSTADDA